MSEKKTFGVEQPERGQLGKGAVETTTKGRERPPVPKSGVGVPQAFPEEESTTREPMVGLGQPELTIAGFEGPSKRKPAETVTFGFWRFRVIKRAVCDLLMLYF